MTLATGARLKAERQRLGLTQAELAKATGITTRTVTDWEAGRTSPSVQNLTQLMDHGMDGIFVLTGDRADQLERAAAHRPDTRPTPETGPIGLLVGSSEVLVYHPAETNRCPRCSSSEWVVGGIAADCATCGTALPLVQPRPSETDIERTDA